MRKAGRHFRWARHPQLFVGAVVLCLVIGALGVAGSRAASWQKAKPYPLLSSEATAFSRPTVDCSYKPCLALTFDDGPDYHYTPQLLDILDKEDVKVTFFLVGSRVSEQPELVRRMHKEGHEIGNHTWHHANLTKITPNQVRSEIYSTQSAIMAAGVPVPKLMRPPYGAIDPMVASHLHMTVVRWNIDPEDWATLNPDYLRENLLSQARPGGIVLMHDTRQSTIDAVHADLPALKERFQLVTVSQLLELSSGDQGQFFSR